MGEKRKVVILGVDLTAFMGRKRLESRRSKSRWGIEFVAKSSGDDPGTFRSPVECRSKAINWVSALFLSLRSLTGYRKEHRAT